MDPIGQEIVGLETAIRFAVASGGKVLLKRLLCRFGLVPRGPVRVPAIKLREQD